MDSSVTELSLTCASAALAEGRTTARDLAEATIGAAGRWQPFINCFISFDADALLAAADASDARRRAGRALGQLDGVPIAYKDMFDRQGQATSGGSILLDDRIAASSAAVIERLEAAGALLAGGLNMAEFAASPAGHNLHHGAAANPWNPAYTAAGSSGGSGAAVAARIVSGTIGSDTGGSIRLPASVNGVVGVKPTYGRVSRRGSVPRMPSSDTIGPLARTAQDCALLLDIIAGHDQRDPTTWNAPDHLALPLIGMDLAGVRIATCRAAPFDSCAGVIEAALREACAVFARDGLPVAEKSVPDASAIYALSDVMAKVEASTLHARWMRERPGAYSSFVYKRTEVGFHIPVQRYYEALALRGRVLSKFVEAVFHDVDALLLPVMPIEVPTLAETAVETPEAVRRVIGRMTAFTRPFNYLGVPSVSVPCGFDGNGMPIAFQLVGRPFSEPLLLALAARYQSLTDWHLRVPILPKEVSS